MGRIVCGYRCASPTLTSRAKNGLKWLGMQCTVFFGKYTGRLSVHYNVLWYQPHCALRLLQNYITIHTQQVNYSSKPSVLGISQKLRCVLGSLLRGHRTASCRALQMAFRLLAPALGLGVAQNGAL